MEINEDHQNVNKENLFTVCCHRALAIITNIWQTHTDIKEMRNLYSEKKKTWKASGML